MRWDKRCCSLLYLFYINDTLIRSVGPLCSENRELNQTLAGFNQRRMWGPAGDKGLGWGGLGQSDLGDSKN